MEFKLRGPKWDEQAVGTVLALAGSATQTLDLEPLNTPVNLLLALGYRVISCSLPFHEDDVHPDAAIEKWYGALESQQDIFSNFFYDIAESLKHQDRLALMGISRGGFAAFHIARLLPKTPVIAYAPITSFAPLNLSDVGKEFARTSGLELTSIAQDLVSNPAFITIGTDDKRVSTDCCYNFFRTLANAAGPSANINLHIGPAVGFKGHGTTLARFEMGVRWLNQL